MRRDKTLMFRILRHFEAQPTYGNLTYPELADVAPDVLAYHVHLAAQAGFIEAAMTDPRVANALPHYEVYGLTWAGHELLHPNGCKS